MKLDMMANWLYERLGIPFFVGPDVPEQPDSMGVITTLPGLGTLNDGLFDQPQFQIAIRGLQRDYANAEAVANKVDKLIVFGDYPNEDWGGWVITAYRNSSSPSPQALDSGRRVVFVCTYVAQEATDFDTED